MVTVRSWFHHWRLRHSYWRWARRHRKVPYEWGGVGDGGFDSTDLQSAVLNAALNKDNTDG